MKEQREKSLEEIVMALPSGHSPDGVIRHQARVEYEHLVKGVDHVNYLLHECERRSSQRCHDAGSCPCVVCVAYRWLASPASGTPLALCRKCGSPRLGFETCFDCSAPHKTTLKDRLKAMASQVRGEEDTQGPSWTCGDCGSARNHGITYPSTPNGPEEHDMVCDDCGSLNIAESPEEAALGLGLKLDECRAEIIGLREDLAEWKRIADGAMADANQNAKAFIVGAEVTFEKLDVTGCGDKGRCHGAMKWCDLCGDVSGVCDSIGCDVHVSCASCGHKITQHGFAQSMGHEGRMQCLMSGCACSWYTRP